jgi:hypothetical protein
MNARPHSNFFINDLLYNRHNNGTHEQMTMIIAPIFTQRRCIRPFVYFAGAAMSWKKIGLRREGHYRQYIQRSARAWWDEYFTALLHNVWSPA